MGRGRETHKDRDFTSVILVGTASWTDPTLIEAGWYPPNVGRNAEKRLRYYAERFPTVEVDSTYYAIPSERNAHLWVERTPEGFVFNVKTLSAFTGHGLEEGENDDRVPAEQGGVVQGRPATAVPGVHVRPQVPQDLDDLRIGTGNDCPMQGGHAACVPGVHVRAQVHQGGDGLQEGAPLRFPLVGENRLGFGE